MVHKPLKLPWIFPGAPLTFNGARGNVQGYLTGMSISQEICTRFPLWSVLLWIDTDWFHRADSRFAPSQWETALHCNDVSHWLGASLESALFRLCSSVSLHRHCVSVPIVPLPTKQVLIVWVNVLHEKPWDDTSFKDKFVLHNIIHQVCSISNEKSKASKHCVLNHWQLYCLFMGCLGW